MKTLRRQRGRLLLWPENAAYQPIVPKRGEELRILGKVIEVRRRLD